MVDEPEGLEKFLRQTIRLPVWTALLICSLTLLSGCILLLGFGALVQKGMLVGQDAGTGVRIAREVAQIPSTVHSLLTQRHPMLVDGKTEPQPPGLSRTAFVDPGYALISRYIAAEDRSVVQLLRLSDGRILKEYRPPIDDINSRSHLETALVNLRRDRTPSRYRMVHPFLMNDGGLMFQDSSPLVRVDACGRVVWTLEGMFHHSLEPAPEGGFWIPSTKLRSGRDGVGMSFHEDLLTRVSDDGKVTYRESLIDLLDRAGLTALWRGDPDYHDDPTHLNDIEPVTADGPYWKRGDLFLSVRNLSTVMLYRPSTHSVIWHQQGPWMGQHDVSIVDDHRISVFGNQAVGGFPARHILGHNRLFVFDFATDSITEPLDQAFKRLNIRSITDGRATPMPDGGFFVEETTFGRLMRLDRKGKLLWSYVSEDERGNRSQLSWSRYLDAKFSAGLSAAAGKQCVASPAH